MAHPHSIFFQNDQLLNIYQEILSFFLWDGLFGEKNLTAAGVLRKNIWFSLPIPKIKFDPPTQGKKYFGVHILGPKSKRNDKNF